MHKDAKHKGLRYEILNLLLNIEPTDHFTAASLYSPNKLCLLLNSSKFKYKMHIFQLHPFLRTDRRGQLCSHESEHL